MKTLKVEMQTAPPQAKPAWNELTLKEKSILWFIRGMFLIGIAALVLALTGWLLVGGSFIREAATKSHQLIAGEAVSK